MELVIIIALILVLAGVGFLLYGKFGENSELRVGIAQLETKIASEREAHKREISTLKDGGQNLSTLSNILTPLQNQIGTFKDTFTTTNDNFSGKFGELKNQITDLKTMNTTLGEEAQNLTNALKGDTKQQGNWGEFVLEKTLEISGLREGREYEAQKSVPDAKGGRRVLDVIVHLPDKKDIVIDPKVSLSDYTQYCSAETEEQRADFLKKHIASVERHISELSAKNYQGSPGVRTLNFVMMFIPVEPAYILTVNEERNIFQKAFDKNIVLVCPSTLLAVLRTIHSLWQMEDRNANAQEIAEEAGKLYDKFAGFVSYMDNLRNQLGTATKTFENAYNSLSTGRGNIVGRAEKMKQLGAKTTKSLPTQIVEDSADEEDLDVEKVEEKRPV